jgi:hypothetical protein
MYFCHYFSTSKQLVIENESPPLASRCIAMSGLIPPIPLETKAAAKTPKHKDTAGTCRERATADLLKSVTMLTANERLALERSAALWQARATFLDRLDDSAGSRDLSAAQGLSA